MFLEENRLLAILPEGHPLSAQERVPLAVCRFLDYLPCRSEET